MLKLKFVSSVFVRLSYHCFKHWTTYLLIINRIFQRLQLGNQRGQACFKWCYVFQQPGEINVVECDRRKLIELLCHKSRHINEIKNTSHLKQGDIVPNALAHANAILSLRRACLEPDTSASCRSLRHRCKIWPTDLQYVHLVHCMYDMLTKCQEIVGYKLLRTHSNYYGQQLICAAR